MKKEKQEGIEETKLILKVMHLRAIIIYYKVVDIKREIYKRNPKDKKYVKEKKWNHKSCNTIIIPKNKELWMEIDYGEDYCHPGSDFFSL